MNACLEAIVNRAASHGFELWVAIMGYDGLVNGNLVPVTRANCSGISGRAGCVIKCGRSEAFTTDSGFAKAIETIKQNGFEGLIVIGGNGTFMGVERLRSAGISVIAIPATIDNDVFFTKHNLGFSSATENAVALIDMLKVTMETNERDHVVQLMGRHNADLAQKVGEASFADVIDTVNKRHSAAEVVQIFKELRNQGKESCLMIMQERKNIDAAHEAIESANFLTELIVAAQDKRIRMNTLGHLQRGAAPSAHDRWLAVNYGNMAVDFAAKKRYGVAIGLLHSEFKAVELSRLK